MTSVVTSSGHLEASEPVKKRVHIADAPAEALDVANAQKGVIGGFTPGSVPDFPSTAELMHKCMSVNPFEAKFAEANRRISSGVLEAHGLAPPFISMPASGSQLLKLSSSLSQSPGIFSNISILTTDVDGMNENLKTADISKLLQQACGDVANAPRTADVLDTVLDMHQGRLHTINYLNKDITSIFSSLTPSGSAPNSAGILGIVASSAAPPTSLPLGAAPLLAVPRAAVTSASPAHSPRQPTASTAADSSPREMEYRSKGSPETTTTLLTLQQQQQDANWDPRDVKPPVGGMPKTHSNGNFFERDGVGSMASMGSMPTVAIPGNGNNLLSLDAVGKSEFGEPSPTQSTSSGRGRGRGRASITTELPADERSGFRMTILERNKAAAVRYRKRKKEEHDDMISRVHGLEQEKQQLATQNQVLRQEMERMRLLLQEREARCVCLKGTRLGLTSDLRSDSPVDILSSPQHGMYIPQATQLINGLGMPNGLGLKRPKM